MRLQLRGVCRLVIVAALLTFVPAAEAEDQVVWRETSTERIKVKYRNGQEIGRWVFKRKPSQVGREVGAPKPAQRPTPSATETVFERQMSVAEFRASGLGRLSRNELIALHNWLVDASKRVVAQRLGISSAGAARAGLSRSSGEYLGGGAGHWIEENINGGAMIRLEDGSIWEVDPLEIIDASLWLAISNITVVRSDAGSPGYPYLLINTDDGEKAHARLVGGH